MTIGPVDPPSACPSCDGPFTRASRRTQTMVGCIRTPGHDHDDNCLSQSFYCALDHETIGHVQRVCPAADCTWRGKVTCFCHVGPKWREWPKIFGSAGAIW